MTKVINLNELTFNDIKNRYLEGNQQLELGKDLRDYSIDGSIIGKNIHGPEKMFDSNNDGLLQWTKINGDVDIRNSSNFHVHLYNSKVFGDVILKDCSDVSIGGSCSEMKDLLFKNFNDGIIGLNYSIINSLDIKNCDDISGINLEKSYCKENCNIYKSNIIDLSLYETNINGDLNINKSNIQHIYNTNGGVIVGNLDLRGSTIDAFSSFGTISIEGCLDLRNCKINYIRNFHNFEYNDILIDDFSKLPSEIMDYID